MGTSYSTTGRRVSHRQQTVLRQALIAYRFAISTFDGAGFEIPEEAHRFGERLAATNVSVPVRCIACNGSFPITVPIGACLSDRSLCQNCAIEMEAMERGQANGSS